MNERATSTAKESATLVDTQNGCYLEIEKVRGQFLMSLYAIKDGRPEPVYDSNNNAYWDRTARTSKEVMGYISEAMNVAKPDSGDMPKGTRMTSIAEYTFSLGEREISQQVTTSRRPQRTAAILAASAGVT